MPLDLEELEMLLAEATPEPWRWDRGVLLGSAEFRGQHIIWPQNASSDGDDWAAWLGACGHDAEKHAPQNAALIVALRNAAGELIALARRGRQTLSGTDVVPASSPRAGGVEAASVPDSAPASPSADELAEALAALMGCVVNRSSVEGDLPWTTDVLIAIQRAGALLARRRAP